MKDLEFARSLMEEEEKSAPKPTEEKTGNSLLDIQKKQQEEMDILVAMKLQQEIYAQDELANKPPPPKLPTWVPHAYMQDKGENRLPPTAEAIKRITSDLKEVLTSNNRDLHVMPDEEDICHIQALIIGPVDTPYANGFFHFDMIYPHDYPWKPPKVNIMTTDSGRTRFNPNLYSNGKVCLSILGTWSGPGWTQIQTMLSTLLSIQSLMNPEPYHNEPGYEQERAPGDVEKYNRCILHETIRVAVCGMMENCTAGDLFQEPMDEIFLEKFDYYVSVCEQNAPLLDGKNMEDPFGEKRGTFKYGSLIKRLHDIKEKVEARKNAVQDMDTSENKEEVVQENNTTSEVKNVPEVKENVTTEVSPMQIDANPPAKTENVPSQNPLLPSHQDLISNIINAFSVTTNNPNGEKLPDLNDNKDLQLAKQLAEQLAVQSSALLSADEEYAKMLQDQEYSTGHQSNKYGYYGEQPQYPNKAPSNFTPVKGRSISELMAETKQEKKGEESDIVCLVCHNSPKEYIILPNCQQPHIYCMTCAEKMVKMGGAPPLNRYNYPRAVPNKRNNGQTIQCVLCSSMSSLDPTAGLAALRRRKKRKLENHLLCPDHSEEFNMFCMECNELVCILCAGAPVHGRHNVEALDIAHTKLVSNMGVQLSTLEQKKGKLGSYITSIEQNREKITKASENIQKDVQTKFADLRRILDEKEKEITEAVKRMETNKQNQINNEVSKAQQRMDDVNKSINIVQESFSEKSSLHFLQKMEEAEEQIRHSSMAIDLEPKNKWFVMPPVNVQYVEQTLKSIVYKERSNQFAIYPEDEVSYYDDQDDVDDEEEADQV
eukprot:TRINITY_DN3460_c0_g1_i2.p1 TRINITY_DN3460_c0_g1~~TRINITY_DN3460_c0_g1_i2.p1  ORF type:complete len:886 (-),score=282.73 TRINITY_DN3460_c0_g1_i2:28-2508(-)